jgi:Recombination endonuclease VII
MKQCKVCAQELPDEKFGNTYHTLSDGTRKAYKDSTCMVCRRNKHLENPEKRAVHRKGTSNWYKNNPDKVKNQRLKKYGITFKDYNALREDQGYCCAICKRHEEQVEQGTALKHSHALHIDHCHTTGKIRGLLCTNCNTMLGKAKDDVSVLEAAIEYLKETQ